MTLNMTASFSTHGTSPLGSNAKRLDETPAPHQMVRYRCPGLPDKGVMAHAFELRMSDGVEEIPHETACPRHGARSKTRQSAYVPPRTHDDARRAKPPRTSWEMLLDRRTEAELEADLQARLAIPRREWVGVTTWLRASQDRRKVTAKSTEGALLESRARWAAAS